MTEREELSGWKAIADFLKVSVRTAQTWESDLGLPVRRLPGPRGRALADPVELVAWKRSCSPESRLAIIPESEADPLAAGTELLAANGAKPINSPAGGEDREGVSHLSGLGKWILAVGVAVILLLVILLERPSSGPTPHVVEGIALTHDGAPKYAPVLTDGRRVYFTELVEGRYKVAASDLTSVETMTIPTAVADPYLCDLSADGKLLLLRSVIGAFDDYGPLFIQPLAGGEAQMLPISAFDAVWTPGAKGIVFARGPEVSLFDLATHQTKLLTSIKGFAWSPRFSPDKNRLRFTVTDSKTQATSIWEIAAGGGTARRLFDEQAPWAAAGTGNWTADGKYFVFQVGPRSASNIWALDETRSFLPSRRQPVQLTFGPSYRGPQPNADGSVVFVRTQLPRAEMFKLEPGGNLTSLLPGILTDAVSFSPDGTSIVYCLADRERTLWYSRSDGSGARRLTAFPTETAFPQWSPDGRFVAVATRSPGRAPWTISIITVDGAGSHRDLKLIDGNALDPNWSPDGRQILFGMIPTLESEVHLYTVDLASDRVSIVPGSDNLFAPAWSPDGRFIAALAADSNRLVILDTKTGTRSIVAESKAGFPVWSRDGQSLYSIMACQSGMCVSRIDAKSHEVRQNIPLGKFPLLDTWMGTSPDGSVLLAKNVGVQEIEMLKLDPKLSGWR